MRNYSFAAFLAVLLASACRVCGHTTTRPPHPSSTTTTTIAASSTTTTTTIAASDSSHILWQGRKASNSDGSVSFDWEGVAAYFSVSGASTVSAFFSSTFLEKPQEERPPSSPRFLQDSTFPKFGVYRIFVDGQRTADVTVFPGAGEQVLVTNLDTSTTHNVSLYYSTDPVFNTWPNVMCPGCVQTVANISTDGTFLPAQQERERRILILGDSITAGNAIYRPLCANASGDDLSASYGALLCDDFGANCTTLAVSSKGIYENCCDSLNTTMKDFVLRRFAQDPSSVYDWTEFSPDVVLVNLGTNDSGHDSGPSWVANFTNTYVNLLVNLTVWLNNPSLPIFCGVGPITERYMPWVLSAMSLAANEGVQTHLLNFTGPELDGCGHPGPVGHRQMYEIARPIISQVMGWT